MTIIKRYSGALAALACLAALSLPASAVVLSNGGFEAGFAGWTRADSLGGDGTFFIQSGSLSPVNGDPVPPPPRGNNAAMTDAGAGGSHALYQDFSVASAAGRYVLSFDLYIANRSGLYSSPATLDWSENFANQQFRVDILKDTADPFSVLAADVLANIYQTMPGDALETGYTTMNFDVTALLNGNVGNSLRLRFAEVDNLGPLQVGIDNVGIAAVPEPATLPLLLGGVLLLTLLRSRT